MNSNLISALLIACALGAPVLGALSEKAGHGIRIYDLNAFHMAFGVLIGLSLLGTVLIIFAKEMFCRQLHE